MVKLEVRIRLTNREVKTCYFCGRDIMKGETYLRASQEMYPGRKTSAACLRCLQDRISEVG